MRASDPACGHALPKSDVVLATVRELQAAGQTPIARAISEASGLPIHRVYYWLNRLEDRGAVALKRDSGSGRLIPGEITIL